MSLISALKTIKASWERKQSEVNEESTDLYNAILFDEDRYKAKAYKISFNLKN